MRKNLARITSIILSMILMILLVDCNVFAEENDWTFGYDESVSENNIIEDDITDYEIEAMQKQIADGAVDGSILEKNSDKDNYVNKSSFIENVNIEFDETYYKRWDRDNYGDHFFNKFTINDRGLITFTATKPVGYSGYKQLRFMLYNSNGDAIWGSDCYKSVDSLDDKYRYYIGLNAGTYYLDIMPFYSYDISTQYSLSYTQDDYCEIESNDTLSTATSILGGRTYRGWYGSDGGDDVEINDYYKIYTEKGVKYQLVIGNFEYIDEYSTTLFNIVDSHGKNYRYGSYSYVDNTNGTRVYTFRPEKDGYTYFKFGNSNQNHLSYTLTVYGSTFKVPQDSLLLVKGETVNTSVLADPILGKTKKCKSSSKKIATVSSSGKIKAKSGGEATIEVYKPWGILQYKVTVEAPIIPKKITVRAGEEIALNVSGTTMPIKYSSSNMYKATVSEDGVVKGVSKGNVIIYTKIRGVSFKTKVKVID